MSDRPALVTVHAWPQDAARALADLRSPPASTVIRIATPDTPLRQASRGQSRTAVRELLSAFGGRPAASIDLLSESGQALQVAWKGPRVGLSLSHTAGISVAAIQVGGAVGVDIMRLARLDGLPDWAAVARDYLGPQAYGRIAKLPPAQRLCAFTREWTRLEAGLKCMGQALTEWTSALELRLTACRRNALCLPAGYCGTLAVT
jgi:4'-phosphopantetheinyl transferase